MKNKVNLPKTYTKEMWEKCKVKEHKKYIGKLAVSWSQIELFCSKSGFNTGLLGEFEYMRKYFSGEKYDDAGWGAFGQEAEAYITLKDKDPKTLSQEDKDVLEAARKNFTDKEKDVLEQIKPLGVFQREICYYVEELDVIVVGYIDDRSKAIKGVIKMLRDYKTKSEASKKDLHDDKKHQIELYVLGERQDGNEVESAEYCIIERLGGRECMQGGGRESLSVGNQIWYEPYEWNDERLAQTHQLVVDTVLNISSLYSTYQKYFGDELSAA